MKALLWVGILFAAPVLAAEKSADEVAIGAVVNRLVEAWNRGDAKAWVQDYAEDAEFTNILGAVLINRKETEVRHDSIFRSVFKGSRAVFTIRKLRFLSPAVAIVDTDAAVSGSPAMPPGIRPDADGVLRTRLKHILEKRDGRWFIVASQNTQILPRPPP